MDLIKTKSGSVIEVRGLWKRKLYINGYPQTQSSYRRDWKTILKRSEVDEILQNGKVLVLGLGGGDVVKLLTNKQTNIAITAVEIEREVIVVADKYFDVRSNSVLEIVCEDAKKYMHDTHAKFDLVVVDLYCGDDVPLFVSGNKFIREIAKTLKSKGKVVFNYASHRFDEKDFTQFEQKLQENFTQVKRLQTWGHTYYLASR